MTWTPWFYWTTLNELDKRINKIDKAWPIIAKKTKFKPEIQHLQYNNHPLPQVWPKEKNFEK